MKTLSSFSLSKKVLATLLPLLMAGQVSAGGVATVYKDCNYGGYAVDLNAGNYTLAQLKALGVADNDISSLKVASGYEVQLFDGDNFLNAPTSLTVSGEVSCLVGRSFNDKTSSIRVRTVGPATAYKDCNVGGTALPAIGDYTTNQLLALGIANNDLSGLKVNSGFEVQLFDGDNFQGESITLVAGTSCLAGGSFDNKTSSLRVRTPGVATFFKDCDFGGYAVALPATGTYTTNQLLALGISNNDISSLIVNSGFEVQLFDGDNLQGPASPIFSVAAGNSRTNCLVASNWNDKTSSIRVRTAATAAATAAKASASQAKPNEREAVANRSVFPTPVSAGGRLTVDLGALCEQAYLELTDLRGAKLATYSYQDVRRVELLLPVLPKGIFLLKVSTAANTSTQKVLVD